MYLGCRFYPFVYVEFSRIPLEKSGLHIFPCTINCQTRVCLGRRFQLGRAGIAAKMRYAFGIPRQGFQRRPIPDAMPQRQHTRMMIPSVQPSAPRVEEAHTLTALILAVWPLARVLALHIVESVLAERARRPTRLAPLPGLWGLAAQ